MWEGISSRSLAGGMVLSHIMTTTSMTIVEQKQFCMGGCLGKSSFTITQDSRLRRAQPFLFSVVDAETVLKDSVVGDYLLYRDHSSDRIVLSVRFPSYIRHHRIYELHGLYYLDGQPYGYLDSIVLYHRRHRLNGLKLQKQAHLSARVVQIFAHKVANGNGNFQLLQDKNSSLSPPSDPNSSYRSLRHSRTNSYASLLTASSSNSSSARPNH